MNYREEIKVFKLKESINLPLAENPNKCANSSVGDLLVCWDNKNVYCKHWNDEGIPSFALLNNTLPFIEINEAFFQNISGNETINDDKN